MDQRAHEDVAVATAVHTELGHEYNSAVAEGLVERISSEIDKQVDARLAERGVQLALQPSQTVWANVAMGLGSVGLGVAATAVTLHSLSTSGVVPKASIDLGSFRASLMTSTSSISTAQVVLIVLIWAVIAVVNIAYARRHLGRPRLLLLRRGCGRRGCARPGRLLPAAPATTLRLVYIGGDGGREAPGCRNGTPCQRSLRAIRRADTRNLGCLTAGSGAEVAGGSVLLPVAAD